MSMEHIFRQWIGMHRAMIAWFHAAHHVTKGTGFGGDHVNLYGEIYTTLDEDLDGIVEKGIGLTGDETLADPVSSLSMAAGLLAQQPASANQDAETIACNAFEVIKYYVKSIEGIYAQFEACGMSLGLDDLLQGLANQYETYVYLLQQRSRTVASPITVTVMENRMKREQLRKTLRRVLTEATMGPRLTRLLTRLKADVDQGKAIRNEWCEFWVNICDNWSDAENIPEDSPECYHLIMEDLLNAADAWNREEEFAGSLWDVAQCLGI